MFFPEVLELDESEAGTPVWKTGQYRDRDGTLFIYLCQNSHFATLALYNRAALSSNILVLILLL